MKLKDNMPKIPPTFARPRSYTLALAIPRFEDMFNSFYALEIIKGIGAASSRLGLDFTVHVTERGRREALFEKKLFDVKYFDGILFADVDGDAELLGKVTASGVPYLVMNNFYADEKINCVGIDNMTGAAEAVRYLIELGHRNIATITGNMGTQAGLERLSGYKDALVQAKINVRGDYIADGAFIRAGAKEAAKDLLRSKPRPTAIFCASDLMALEAIAIIEEEGLRVPDDVSIIGFDNSPLAAGARVPLTSVEQPLFEMARQGAEILNQIIQNKKKPPVKILLPTKLIKRESTAAHKREA